MHSLTHSLNPKPQASIPFHRLYHNMSYMQSHSKKSSSAGGSGMHSSKCRLTAQDEASGRILRATPTKFMTHTPGVSCHVFINNFQVYRYDAHAESMHHEREPNFHQNQSLFAFTATTGIQKTSIKNQVG